MKPTVGRIVYYKSYGSPVLPDGTQKYESKDRAAIVTEVLEGVDGEPTLASLCVLNPEGMFFKELCSQGQEGGQWDWMPFQKDQQARLNPSADDKA